MGRIRDWFEDVKEHKGRILIAVILVFISIILDYISGFYVNSKANVSEVQDLILNHIPAINLNFIFVWLFMIVMAILFAYPLIFKPRKIHYYFGIASLFIATRSLFIVLTHLKTPIEAIPVKFPWLAEKIFFSNDMFFSGHVGIPFLGFLLIYNDNRKLSYFMLASSIILGISALFMHQHYSIDVLAAFFITYGVYKIGNRIFGNKK